MYTTAKTNCKVQLPLIFRLFVLNCSKNNIWSNFIIAGVDNHKFQLKKNKFACIKANPKWMVRLHFEIFGVKFYDFFQKKTKSFNNFFVIFSS